MNLIPIGAKVRQVVKPIEGVIIKRIFDDSTGMQYLVQTESDENADGVPDERWFQDKDVAEVKPDVTDVEAKPAK